MRRKHLSVLAALALAVGLLLLAVAGCGGKDTTSTTSSPAASAVTTNLSAQEIVDQSNAKMADVTSASFTADMALKIQGDTTQMSDPTAQALLGNGITLHAEGQSSSDPVAMDMDLSVTIADQALDLGLMADGAKVWVGYQDQWYAVDQKQASSLSAQTKQGAAPTEQLKSFGLDPEEWGTSYKLVGTEELNGMSVYHVQATADPQKLAAALMKAANDPELAKKLGDDSTAKQLKQALKQNREDATALQKSLKNVAVDYWIGVDDMLMYKAQFAAALDTSGQKDMEGLEGMSLDVTMTMSDYNEPVSVEPPANAKSFDKLMERMFGGMTIGS